MIFERLRRRRRQRTENVSEPAIEVSQPLEPDLAEAALIQRFETVHGRRADYGTPTTFTEMLSKRLIDLAHDENPLFTRLTDKLAVRHYVADRVGSEYLVPLVWHGDDPDLIPFDRLPRDCIFKVNHGSGGHMSMSGGIVDAVAVRAHLREKLQERYHDRYLEYQYRGIAPMILIETIVDDGIIEGPVTYRLYAFDGDVALIQADTQTNSLYAFYDTFWNSVDLSYRDVAISRVGSPSRLADMLRIASKLSRGIDFVRVDLYAARGAIYFSEMTFTPMAGSLRFNDPSWDRTLGDRWLSSQRRLG